MENDNRDIIIKRTEYNDNCKICKLNKNKCFEDTPNYGLIPIFYEGFMVDGICDDCFLKIIEKICYIDDYFINILQDKLQEIKNKNRKEIFYKKKKIGNLLRKKVFERDKYRCIKCKTHINLTIDHIYPESKGGLTNLNNLQTLCKCCNSKKGTKI